MLFSVSDGSPQKIRSLEASSRHSRRTSYLKMELAPQPVLGLLPTFLHQVGREA